MPTEKWDVFTSRGDVLTTEMDGLANGNYSNVGSTVLGNDVNLDRWAVAEWTGTFGSAPTDESVLEVYIHVSLDGTNYPDGGNSDHPGASLHVADIPLVNNTNAQRVQSAPFQLMPGKTKFSICNRSGVAMPNGSHLKIYTTNRTVG